MVLLTLESVYEMLKCDHLNESYWAVLFCVTISCAAQGGSDVSVRMKSYGVTIQMKFTEQYFPVVPVNFVMLYKVVTKVWPFKWKLLSSTFLWHCLLCWTKWFCRLSVCMTSCGVTIQIKCTEKYLLVILFIMLYKVVLTFECGWDDQVWPFKWKQPRSTFLW